MFAIYSFFLCKTEILLRYIYFFYYTKGVIEKKLQFSFKDRRSVASQYKET